MGLKNFLENIFLFQKSDSRKNHSQNRVGEVSQISLVDALYHYVVNERSKYCNGRKVVIRKIDWRAYAERFAMFLNGEIKQDIWELFLKWLETDKLLAVKFYSNEGKSQITKVYGLEYDGEPALYLHPNPQYYFLTWMDAWRYKRAMAREIKKLKKTKRSLEKVVLEANDLQDRFRKSRVVSQHIHVYRDA